VSAVRAIVLVDHGSREEAANAQLEQVAALLRERLGGTLVRVAHLQLVEPTLEAAVDACVADGAEEVVIAPYFLAPGRHATADITRAIVALEARHAGLRLRAAAPLGVHVGIVNALEERIAQAK
jgi:sirohydrochlorin ferrochelatase